MTTRTGGARDRLLLAAAQLLDESGDRTLSTRAVCAMAGVQAPTLYHHFGSKQGLIDAVVNHGFSQYARSGPTDGWVDPIDDIRRGWDRHVQFGLEHPTFYALLYGHIEPGRPCAITGPAQAMLLELLAAAARHGLLKVTPVDGAAQILAANVGVTLSLITQPRETPDPGLSERVREAALAGVLVDPSPRSQRQTSTNPVKSTDANQPACPPSSSRSACLEPEPARGCQDGYAPASHGETSRADWAGPSRATAALTLRALLDADGRGLTPGEATLLGELLDRLSGPGS